MLITTRENSTKGPVHFPFEVHIGIKRFILDGTLLCQREGLTLDQKKVMANVEGYSRERVICDAFKIQK